MNRSTVAVLGIERHAHESTVQNPSLELRSYRLLRTRYNTLEGREGEREREGRGEREGRERERGRGEEREREGREGGERVRGESEGRGRICEIIIITLSIHTCTCTTCCVDLLLIETEAHTIVVLQNPRQVGVTEVGGACSCSD